MCVSVLKGLLLTVVLIDSDIDGVIVPDFEFLIDTELVADSEEVLLEDTLAVPLIDTLEVLLEDTLLLLVIEVVDVLLLELLAVLVLDTDADFVFVELDVIVFVCNGVAELVVLSEYEEE